MKWKNSFAFIAVATALISGCATTGAPPQADAKYVAKSGYAPVNGLKMYYEIHCSGLGVPRFREQPNSHDEQG